MKRIVYLSLAVCSLTGCAIFYDAPRADQDYGKAQAEIWSRQVAYQHPAQVETIPEGLGGLPSEAVMKKYNQSFGNKASKEDVFKMGVTGESSK